MLGASRVRVAWWSRQQDTQNLPDSENRFVVAGDVGVIHTSGVQPEARPEEAGSRYGPLVHTVGLGLEVRNQVPWGPCHTLN